MKWLMTFLETYQYDSILNQLELFLSSNSNRSWIWDDQDSPILSIYVRKAHHLVGGKMYKFLDLASISILEEKQGQGIFTGFLEKIIKKYPTTNIYVESILNPRVRQICQKFGFQDVGESNMALIRES